MMNKQNFWVDWDDPPYPTIRPASEAGNLHGEFKTLRQCKREIREHARDIRKHWLAVMHHTEALTETMIYQGKN
jgi:hypothetical protein